MNFNPLFPEDTSPAGLYVHVPFCRSRCSYCGFVSSIYSPERANRFLNSVLREIELRSRHLRESGINLHFDTIYFGGGTPSLLSADEISTLIDACKNSFEFSCEPEITLEINPGTSNLSSFSQFKNIGINRAGLGIQSLIDAELKTMGRLHDPVQAIEAFRDLRNAGFDNISTDLIAGFPGQTMDSLRYSLEALMDLQPEHLSVYMLEIKNGTGLSEMIRNSELRPVPDDLAADMYEEICRKASERGYQHYEISNFALPGRFSRHNMKYWTDSVFLGFGPGAHGMNGRQRYSNEEDLDIYENALSKGVLPLGTVCDMTAEERFKDALIMGLRLVNGVNLDLIGRRYQVDATAFVRDTIGDLSSAGLFEFRDRTILLTPRGRLLSNIVFSRWV